MNQERRKLACKNLKNFVGQKHKHLQFLTLSRNLKDPLVGPRLRGKPTTVRCECLECSQPTDVVVLSEDRLWPFVFSGDWSGSSCLRICEGDLLHRILHTLPAMEEQGQLLSHKTAVYTKCCFPKINESRSILKTTDKQEINMVAEHVKINFVTFSFNVPSDPDNICNSEEESEILDDDNNDVAQQLDADARSLSPLSSAASAGPSGSETEAQRRDSDANRNQGPRSDASSIQGPGCPGNASVSKSVATLDVTGSESHCSNAGHWAAHRRTGAQLMGDLQRMKCCKNKKIKISTEHWNICEVATPRPRRSDMDSLDALLRCLRGLHSQEYKRYAFFSKRCHGNDVTTPSRGGDVAEDDPGATSPSSKRKRGQSEQEQSNEVAVVERGWSTSTSSTSVNAPVPDEVRFSITAYLFAPTKNKGHNAQQHEEERSKRKPKRSKAKTALVKGKQPSNETPESSSDVTGAATPAVTKKKKRRGAPLTQGESAETTPAAITTRHNPSVTMETEDGKEPAPQEAPTEPKATKTENATKKKATKLKSPSTLRKPLKKQPQFVSLPVMKKQRKVVTTATETAVESDTQTTSPVFTYKLSDVKNAPNPETPPETKKTMRRMSEPQAPTLAAMKTRLRDQDNGADATPSARRQRALSLPTIYPKNAPLLQQVILEALTNKAAANYNPKVLSHEQTISAWEKKPKKDLRSAPDSVLGSTHEQKTPSRWSKEPTKDPSARDSVLESTHGQKTSAWDKEPTKDLPSILEFSHGQEWGKKSKKDLPSVRDSVLGSSLTDLSTLELKQLMNVDLLVKLRPSYSRETMWRKHKKKSREMMRQDDIVEKRLQRIVNKLQDPGCEAALSSPPRLPILMMTSQNEDDSSPDVNSDWLTRELHYENSAACADFRACLVEALQRFVVTKETVTRLGGRPPIISITVTKPDTHHCETLQQICKEPGLPCSDTNPLDQSKASPETDDESSLSTQTLRAPECDVIAHADSIPARTNQRTILRDELTLHSGVDVHSNNEDPSNDVEDEAVTSSWTFAPHLSPRQLFHMEKHLKS